MANVKEKSGILPMEVTEENPIATAWPKWRKTFRIYMIAEGLTDKGVKESKKVAEMLRWIGELGRDIYFSLNEDRREDLSDVKLEDVIVQFDQYCAPFKNVPMESFMFHEIKQKEGETIEALICRLRMQAKNCDFKCTNDECQQSYESRAIRDQLVIGLKEPQLKARLLEKKEENLDKVIQMCQVFAKTKSDVKTLGESSVASQEQVCAVRSNLQRGARELKCFKCGFVPYTTAHECKRKEPKKEPKCYACDEIGHFKNKCPLREKKGAGIRGIREETGVYVNSIQERKWVRKFEVNGINVSMEIDTGAGANCLPRRFVRGRIDQTLMRLKDYNEEPIAVLGQVWRTCVDVKTGASNRLLFAVVKDDRDPILGLKAAETFGYINVEVNAVRGNQKEAFISKYRDAFEGLGKIPGNVTIELAEGAIAKQNYRKRFPLEMEEKLKKELNLRVKEGIIAPVTQPTDWINNLQVVEKVNGEIRLCLDPRQLNKSIRREHYLIPTTETLTAQLATKKVFSVLDLKSGFWQIELDESSALLTAFMTPFGRYYWKRLPFGLSCAPEIFQRKMYEIFGDIPGVFIYFDDFCVTGRDEHEHDTAMEEVMRRAKQNNVKFNAEKIQYKQSKIVFMGQVITGSSMEVNSKHSDPIIHMQTPKDKAGVTRFLGLLKYIARYIPRLSEATANLRELTRHDVDFVWEEKHNREFQELQSFVASKKVLGKFDQKKRVVIQTDASKDGLGCTLMQEGRPVAFASRTLHKNEKKWAQIEKELLAIVFACQRFHYFVYGREFVVESDHKPLEALMKKDIDSVPMRLQSMMMMLLKYPMMEIVFKPGKDMLVADCLSRAQVEEVEEVKELSVMIHKITRKVCVSKSNYETYLRAIEKDEQLQRICEYVEGNWPGFHKLDKFSQEFYKIKSELHYENGLLLWNDRLVVPRVLQSEVAKWLHKAHFGVEKTLAKCRELYYWHGWTNDIKKMIQECRVCEKFANNNAREPLMMEEMPRFPNHIAGMDILEYQGKEYLSVYDSYSNWLFVTEIERKTSGYLIKKLKDCYSMVGYPTVIRADNSPFGSTEFKEFAEAYNIQLRFSSPRHPQSNGLAEKGVAIAKNILKRWKEVNNGTGFQEWILEYNNTPVAGLGLAPTQLFFGRRLKSELPVTENVLERYYIKEDVVRQRIAERRGKQKEYFDKGTKLLEVIKIGDKVNFKRDEKSVFEEGVIIARKGDRTYMIRDRQGKTFVRNRKFIRMRFGEDKKELVNTDTIIDAGDINEANLDVSFQVRPGQTREHQMSGHGESDGFETAESEPDVEVERNSRERRMPAYLREYDLSSI